jgi:hypothetical protein
MRRFLLERVDDPDFVAKLYGIDNAEGVAPECRSDFKYAGSEALHWLRDVRIATFRRDRKRPEKTDRVLSGKASKPLRLP